VNEQNAPLSLSILFATGLNSKPPYDLRLGNVHKIRRKLEEGGRGQISLKFQHGGGTLSSKEFNADITEKQQAMFKNGTNYKFEPF
jgi:hypothetical protein